MKNKLLIIVSILIGIKSFAQVPQGIPYQAVARNGQGQPLASTNVKVRFSILDSTVTGTAVYVEAHSATTSALGLFTANVGMGPASTGTFNSINWGQNYKFLKVELDITATGNSYIDLGTQQMMSVPYALYAGSISSGSSQFNNQPVLIMSSPSPLITNNPWGINGYTFEMAMDYCRVLTENGFSDWRLPSHDELIRFIEVNGYQNIETVWTTSFSGVGHIVLRKEPDYVGFRHKFDSGADHSPAMNTAINCFR